MVRQDSFTSFGGCANLAEDLFGPVRIFGLNGQARTSDQRSQIEFV